MHRSENLNFTDSKTKKYDTELHQISMNAINFGFTESSRVIGNLEESFA